MSDDWGLIYAIQMLKGGRRWPDGSEFRGPPASIHRYSRDWVRRSVQTFSLGGRAAFGLDNLQIISLRTDEAYRSAAGGQKSIEMRATGS